MCMSKMDNPNGSRDDGHGNIISIGALGDNQTNQGVARNPGKKEDQGTGNQSEKTRSIGEKANGENEFEDTKRVMPAKEVGEEIEFDKI